MNKVAIVTGSRRGIGLGIAKMLSENGYTVVLSASSSAEDSVDVCKETGLEYIQCNIAVPEDRENLINKVIEKYGRLDVLVNNAGVAPKIRLDVLETTTESFERLMSINLEGTFFMCQIAANAMIKLLGKVEDYSPRIVNISSMSAYTSSTSRGEYCISKAGIAMVTTLFADRLAEYGIPVFEVRPGIIKPDMTSTVLDKYTKLIDGGLLPTKRMGTPEDVAGCVLAACSGYLDYGTGTVLNADGGFHIRRL